jgi:1,5-anhydro-D-fructose reductase (1,5-anhydro-D-mannitol-forming)
MPDAWRQQKSLSGGGALMDMGVHCIDLIQYITGSRIKKIAAFNDTKVFKYDVEDSSSVLFELENGAYGHVDSNFNIPDAASKWRLELYGTKGRILADETIGQVEGGKPDVILADNSAEFLK